MKDCCINNLQNKANESWVRNLIDPVNNSNYKYFENCNVALIFVFFILLIVFLAGVGLYLEASIIDHSCIPNANVVFSGCQLHLRAIENIQTFSDVRISYTNLLGKYSFQDSEHALQFPWAMGWRKKQHEVEKLKN